MPVRGVKGGLMVEVPLPSGSRILPLEGSSVNIYGMPDVWGRQKHRAEWWLACSKSNSGRTELCVGAAGYEA